MNAPLSVRPVAARISFRVKPIPFVESAVMTFMCGPAFLNNA